MFYLLCGGYKWCFLASYISRRCVQYATIRASPILIIYHIYYRYTVASSEQSLLIWKNATLNSSCIRARSRACTHKHTHTTEPHIDGMLGFSKWTVQRRPTSWNICVLYIVKDARWHRQRAFALNNKWCNIAALRFHLYRLQALLIFMRCWIVPFRCSLTRHHLVHILWQTCKHPLQLWLVSKFPTVNVRLCIHKPSLSYDACSNIFKTSPLSRNVQQLWHFVRLRLRKILQLHSGSATRSTSHSTYLWIYIFKSLSLHAHTVWHRQFEFMHDVHHQHNRLTLFFSANYVWMLGLSGILELYTAQGFDNARASVCVCFDTNHQFWTRHFTSVIFQLFSAQVTGNKFYR